MCLTVVTEPIHTSFGWFWKLRNIHWIGTPGFYNRRGSRSYWRIRQIEVIAKDFALFLLNGFVVSRCACTLSNEVVAESTRYLSFAESWNVDTNPTIYHRKLHQLSCCVRFRDRERIMVGGVCRCFFIRASMPDEIVLWWKDCAHSSLRWKFFPILTDVWSSVGM